MHTYIKAEKRALFLIWLALFSNLVLPAQQPAIGIVQDMERDSLLYVSGYSYLVESISKCFSPRNVTGLQFEEHLAAIKGLKVPLYAVNIFIPGELKLVGPEVNEAAILEYADQVFRRCRQAGVRMIVWGSGGARRVPEGFDREKAKVQFIAIAQKICTLAKPYQIVIALENLNSTETNFINTLAEAHEIVRSVGRPNFRLCADIYHMLKEQEQPAIIEKAGKYIIHCDLAEKENRTPPGTKGDDFSPYLRALKKIRYKGHIMLECRWENIAVQAAPARLELQRQIDEVYGKE